MTADRSLVTRGSGPTLVFLPLGEFYLTPMTTVRAWADVVAAQVPEIEVRVAEPGDEARALADADAAFGALTPALLAAAPRLRWLQAPAAAPPSEFWFPELVTHPVVVTNLRGVYRENLSNHVMACLLGFARGLPSFRAHQQQRQWYRDPVQAGIVDLAATTVLVIGVGEVGQVIARRCQSFGMRVIGVDARPELVDAPLDVLEPPSALDDLLPEADWVVLTVPHSPDTEGLINRARLRLMRSSAVLINVGRGPTVCLDDVVAALDAREIAGAALDVFEIEPLPSEHPLWAYDNVVITPHVAGFGQDTDAERMDLIVDNARRFATGRPLRHVVDKELRF